MAYWTAGKIRDLLKDIPDDEGVAAWINTRNSLSLDDSPTPEVWEAALNKWEYQVAQENDNYLYEALLELLPEDETEVE